MKYIKLTQNKRAIVDDEDYLVLSRFSWHFCNSQTFPYTAHKPKTDSGKKTTHNLPIIIFLTVNRFGKNAIPIDGDYLNCRKENIKLVSIRNKKQFARKVKTFKGKPPTSKYKGVSKHTWKKKGDIIGSSWRAYINPRIRKGVDVGRAYQIALGNFKTEKEAGLAYNKKAKELYGEFAYQNKI